MFWKTYSTLFIVQVALLDPVPGIHVQKQLELEKNKSLSFANACNHPVALSAGNLPHIFLFTIKI